MYLARGPRERGGQRFPKEGAPVNMTVIIMIKYLLMVK